MTMFQTILKGSSSNKSIIDKTFSIIDKYRLKPKPSAVRDVIDYMKLDQKQKENIRNNGAFFRRKEIMSYFNAMMSLENERDSWSAHMKWCYENCEPHQKNDFMAKYQELESDRFWVFGKGPIMREDIMTRIEVAKENERVLPNN